MWCVLLMVLARTNIAEAAEKEPTMSPNCLQNVARCHHPNRRSLAVEREAREELEGMRRRLLVLSPDEVGLR